MNAKNLGLGASLQSTTLEFGFYLEDDVFLTFLVRPLAGDDAASQTSTDVFGGVRLDWQISETWTLQSFYEERQLRQRSVGFDQAQFKAEKIPGFFLFREFGYGRPGGDPAAPPVQALGQLGQTNPIGIRWRRPRSGSAP